METWIVFTLLAVTMQSVRTAGQKKISEKMSIQATTLVRFLFGLPFAIAYFLVLKNQYQIDSIAVDGGFFMPASLAALAQIIATVCLVKALTLKNFAVATALSKSEAILTAVLGSLLFSAGLSLIGYFSVVLGVVGVLVAAKWKVSLRDLSDNQSIRYGLGAGLGFALASLWLRQSSLSLELPRLLSAATVLVYMVALQTLICGVWITVTDRVQFSLIKSNLPASLFIGFTSVAGSIGWFTAMSLQNAALVKTLGQTEFVVTLLITYFYFGEKISRQEYLGIALVFLSIVFLIYA
ncbi:MAG: DMT family transporter [Gammaproteobacteria bacterium]|nr:DMT family transporter [Gammaproteobacteria bacterium]MBT3858256.1 DMT family transporter [Gammaproteobacteria bacterium]MBT3988621.1 DMT family transporter [Gammaproteobacteria bacterium]MBT4256476.1 DMT family transporter [Gammaproteobacteria bacterium]MBT4580441.1 DMT family transporter [Gammaproteobacteria bacterium]